MQINQNNSGQKRPLVVFTTCHPWIQQVVADVQPPEFDVQFLDMSDAAAIQAVLPQTDFLVCLKLSAAQARLLGNCKLVMHNGVGYDGIAVQTLREMGIPVAITPASWNARTSISSRPIPPRSVSEIACSSRSCTTRSASLSQEAR